MTDREKLTALLENIDGESGFRLLGYHDVRRIADHLIANGVTIPVRCKECRYYNEDSEYCGFWGECRHPEHFCDEGERRTE